MRYENQGEGGGEVELKNRHDEPAGFDVTRGDNGDVCLELFGGSGVGEFYTMTLEEAETLHRSLGYIIKIQKEGLNGRF